MRFALSTAILLLLFGPSQAQMLPEFDSVEACYDRVPLASTNEDGVPACVAREELDAEALRAAYPRIPPAVRAECEAYARRVANGWGSYAVLGDCIGQKDFRRARFRARWSREPGR